MNAYVAMGLCFFLGQMSGFLIAYLSYVYHINKHGRK